MQKSLWLGALVGGVIIFVWSAISEMFMPWHEMFYQSFTNEEAVGQAMKQNAPHSGIYLYPMGDCHNPQLTDEQRKKAEEEAWAKMETGPFAFVVYQKDGTGGMLPLMALSLLFDILCALVIAWLVLQTAAPDYMGKVKFILMVSVAASLMIHFPYWIWWGFPMDYTLVNLLDTAFGWALAGLGMGKVMK